ncbi:NAD(P)/FAD-dependent oxidoreductase [Halococcus sp. AFM35]|uniref:NAD(P)/FAD-dependent oxidoreductase n=1 Tax=Halococcus sp. AFM35 TaxID=3421653 RepID=UPI003EB727BE
MTVAIVGAGVAGAGAAYALDGAADVTVFEKEPTVGGRTATRRNHGCRYDYGANYCKDEGRVADLLADLDTEGLVDIDAPVWTFDGENDVSEGRDTDDRKWTYREGIDQLAKRLFERTDATVETNTRIGRIERTDGWRIESVGGGDAGTFDSLVLTPPAPQTASLLADAAWESNFRADLVESVETVPYRTTITAVLHYPFSLDRPYYALVNIDGEHDIGWLSREECKPSHVPDGESLLIAQMAPGWSTERYGEPTDDIAAAAADMVADLLDDERLAEPDWVDGHGWRLAQPDGGVDGDLLDSAERAGLFFAGDWVDGEGRIHLALDSGLDAGERIVERS